MTAGRGGPGRIADAVDNLRTCIGFQSGGWCISAACLSVEPRFSSSWWVREMAVGGRLISSRRARSRSRRISTSIRHSIILLISSSAYTLTPSRRPAMATRTPRCSMTTMLLNGALRTRA